MNVRTAACMALLVLSALEAYAQEKTVMFWTDDRKLVNTKIYINGRKAGTVKKSYPTEPEYGAKGCVTVEIDGEARDSWTALSVIGWTWDTSPLEIEGDRHAIKLEMQEQYRYGGGTYEKLVARPGLAAAVAIGIVPVGIVGLSNDIYAGMIVADSYSGYSFGFRNTLDPHIDIELGMSVVRGGDMSFCAIGANTFDFSDRVNTWTLDINAVYNIFDKCRNHNCARLVNPYFGFAFSTLFDMNIEHKAAFGGIVGVSAGRQLKLHLRYRNMNNFTTGDKVFNHLEMGLTLRFQRKSFFAK